MWKKPELLAPAGSFEKLVFAIEYGADAVYAGGKEFSLRKSAKNFSNSELEKAVNYVHEKGKKIYIAVNSYYRDNDFDDLLKFLRFLEKIKIDAVIVSDPGVVYFIHENKINIPVHLSTQANTTNSFSGKLWGQFGVERLILARELSFEELRLMSKNSNLELETFVHGAMCVSYSGRCLLSSYMTGRDSNKGDCSQPCRWQYKTYFLEEQKRKNIFYPVMEDETGTYIFNSADLNLSRSIPDLMDIGIASLKIEGRMKSSYYVAMVCKVYREIIDEYYEKGSDFKFKEEWERELKKISYRNYTQAAFYDSFSEKDQVYNDNFYNRSHKILAYVEDFEKEFTVLKVKNEIHYGQQVEFIGPDGTFTEILHDFYVKDEDGNMVRTMKGKHNHLIYMKLDKPVKKYCILRSRNVSNAK